jgi:Asp/Glu/hydantoin racemase
MSPRQILLINPNTTASVTALLAQRAQAVWGEGVQAHVRTARWGAPYIACEASYAVGAHVALDEWAQFVHAGGHADAVLIGCFGDPGLQALQASSAAPVTGLAEASFMEAATLGRFAIVTGGERWPSMLARLVHACGFEAAFAGTQTVQATGAQLAQDPEGAARVLLAACQEAQARWSVDAIIIGGAGLAGMAQRLQPDCETSLIDSVEAGARRALALAQAGAVGPSQGFEVAWQGMGAAMTALGRS